MFDSVCLSFNLNLPIKLNKFLHTPRHNVLICTVKVVDMIRHVIVTVVKNRQMQTLFKNQY